MRDHEQQPSGAVSGGTQGPRPVCVITYGTFDLFHEGHVRLLERARTLGDRLIVGVTTDSYDDARGKLNVQQSLMQRIRNVQESGLADEIIIEEYEGQKISDIERYGVDIFAIGSDWRGRFDYLADYCAVVYLERTAGVSSTLLRNQANGILEFGVVGTGRIAERFVPECRYVSGVEIVGVHSRTPSGAAAFAERHELEFAAADYDDLLTRVQAVYVATPHETHFEYARRAIVRGVHVLCEKPLTLSGSESATLYSLAREHGVVLLEAIKTAYAPGFQRMVAVARSGVVGELRSVTASFTKLVDDDVREVVGPHGGSLSELASYPLLAVTKLLGTHPQRMTTYSYRPPGSQVDHFSRIDLMFPHAIATAFVGLGVKHEGDLVAAGTRGCLYVPAPWWKTEFFEARFEDPTRNQKYYLKFDGDGLRYEVAEFASLVRSGRPESFKLRAHESVLLSTLIERARSDAITFGSATSPGTSDADAGIRIPLQSTSLDAPDGRLSMLGS